MPKPVSDKTASQPPPNRSTIVYPEFVDDRDFMQMDSSISEINQLRAMLSNMTRIHLLSACKFINFDELIREYLLSGIEIFGLETGIVSEFTSGEQYLVRDVISPLEMLHPGQVFPIAETYCKVVAQTQKVIGFPHIGELEYMRCHPVYQNLKLEAYLSAPIFVGERLFGTLNFTSTVARVRGFSRHERDLISLMAHSIGAYILLSSKESRLLELNERMRRFVGYVAHDLRNPLGTIIGLAKLGQKKDTPPERAATVLATIYSAGERALEMVNTILDRAAVATGKLSLDTKTVDLTHIIRQAINHTQLFAQERHNTLIVQQAEPCVVNADEHRLQQALSNLFINAIKYSPPGSGITINIHADDDHYNIQITNTINPNLPQLDDHNLRTLGSIGFGLDIVDEVLKAHDSERLTTQNDDRFCVNFCLKRADATTQASSP